MKNAVWLVCCLFLTIFNSNDGQECDGNFDLKQCNSGECISSDLFCNGAKDCKDGSDETGENCLKHDCPSFAFRCTYGACISVKGKCDGTVDCADGSDENALLCGYPAREGVIPPNIFKCVSGQRIALDGACDGTKDCTDGSDETTELCTNVACPSWGFRCAYGGCISKNLMCNGVNDCVDGADEYKSICGKDTYTTTPKIEVSTIVTTTTTDSNFVLPQNGCVIPDVPNLIVILDSGIEEIMASGTYVEEFISIKYKCNPKHLLEGASTNFCFKGEWLSEHPKCNKYCASQHLNGITFSASCEYGGVGISCDQPLRVGTIAKIACQVGYRKPDRYVQEILYCDDSGEWDYSPFRCEPVCGTEQTETTPFIIGGDKANITIVPWQAAIYSTYKGSYEQICGGTIINAKIVISAAHCFWDETQRRPYNYSYFSVGVGKYYRDFFAQEPLPAQYFNVSEIHIANGYQDSSQAYQNDIALLVLSKFIAFKSYIKPICLEWLSYSKKGMNTGVVGRVAGWGRTGPNLQPSNELRILDSAAVSYSDCISRIDVRFRTEIAGDKFCVPSVEGETSCTGDSGGGFVVPKSINGIKTYFLWGIVSNGLTTRGSCEGDFYTAYTNIQYHSSMIMEYETKYRPK